MMKRGLAVLFFLYASCISAFGQESQEVVTSVKIIQPIKGEQIEPVIADVKAANETKVIASQIELDPGEEYESSYFDVGEFREIAFYVVPNNIGTLMSQPDIYYQLDAFFSLESASDSVWEIGSEKQTQISSGWQEFGGSFVDAEGSTAKPSFTRLTTGKTAYRVLYTKVYGPFVRVVLRNLNPEKKCKFKIVAYLMR